MLRTEKVAGLLADLGDKIKSKYDVAKLFLGALVVNTGLILNTGIWGEPQEWEAAPVAGIVAHCLLRTCADAEAKGKIGFVRVTGSAATVKQPG